jgi:Ca2+-transporting ATPase
MSLTCLDAFFLDRSGTAGTAIAVDSTAFEDIDPQTVELVFIGSKTETALLKFAKELGWADYKKTRDAAAVVQMIPFSSERKAMGIVVKLADGQSRLYSMVRAKY